MEEEIRTSIDSSSSINLPLRTICHVCHKQFSHYTCPRCNSRYCSLQCYKSHSNRCTESFMRENVVEELRQLRTDDSTKLKTLDILKRFHLEEERENLDEEDDSTLSEETIEKVLAGDQLSFDDLSVEEKKRFLRAMASGELSKMIEPWEAWWTKPSARTISLSKEGTPLVQLPAEQKPTTSLASGMEAMQSSAIPQAPDTPLPPLSKLSSAEPSPLLAIHLVDIIYSYCFTLRLYNGDWQSDAIGSALVVLSVSSVLGQTGQPETVLEALSSCLEQTCSPTYRHVGGLQLGLSLIDDVAILLSLGSPALVCLLCDLQRLIQAGERDLKSEKRRRKSKWSNIGTKLKHADRKIFFIMCWVHEQPSEVWSTLENIVKMEKSSIMEFENHKLSTKMDNKVKSRDKVLIQEIK
ncbi:zinc finger HIT domain-containing protein 2 [Benincasa hispida]|uniref:zinc finger HIT domain-containing protein 2 n=1 Tax=Benincasa hispida TaxID=102211 RepID=UPI0019018359|nr:zinc finger HIT domain-containing protein 2 [Benincasa hispida]